MIEVGQEQAGSISTPAEHRGVPAVLALESLLHRLRDFQGRVAAELVSALGEKGPDPGFGESNFSPAAAWSSTDRSPWARAAA